MANYGEKSQYVALDSTSLELLRQVQLLLLGFGIKAKIYRNRRGVGANRAIFPMARKGQVLSGSAGAFPSNFPYLAEFSSSGDWLYD